MKRQILMLAVTTAALGTMIVPAAQATPTCDGATVYNNGVVPFNRGSGSVSCNMVRGNFSDGVRALQASLNVCYHQGIAEDGSFGGNTYNALKNAQRQAGTTADGVYGPNTRRAMLHMRYGTRNACVRVP